MEAHDFVGTANELLAYKHSWYARLASQFKQCPLYLLPITDLVKLINSGICPKTIYQWCDGVAQATAAFAEYHHWLFCYHACDQVHCMQDDGA